MTKIIQYIFQHYYKMGCINGIYIIGYNIKMLHNIFFKCPIIQFYFYNVYLLPVLLEIFFHVKEIACNYKINVFMLI